MHNLKSPLPGHEAAIKLLLPQSKFWMIWSLWRILTRSSLISRSMNLLKSSIWVVCTPGTVKQWSQGTTVHWFVASRRSQIQYRWASQSQLSLKMPALNFTLHFWSPSIQKSVQLAEGQSSHRILELTQRWSRIICVSAWRSFPGLCMD